MTRSATESDTGAPAAAGRRPRIRGIDVARALAILGMLTVHVGPTDAEGVAGTLYALPHGRSAILFGLLAGVGTSLLTRSRSTSPAEARLKLAWRALVLLPIGLLLQLLDHNVFVILQDYALLFVLGILVVTLADGVLLALAGVTWALGTTGYLYGLIHAPDAFAREPVQWGDPLGEAVHGLVLSGPYPLITWAAPFLLGVWLGRRDLRRPTLQWAMAGVGAAGTLAVLVVSRVLTAVLGEPTDVPGWDHLLFDTPHSQMPLWLLGASSSAVMVLGLSLLVADLLPRTIWPLAAAGQLAFTVYVGHLLALHRWHEALTSGEVGEAVIIVLGFTVVAMVVATAWRAVWPQGPLELLLRGPWAVVRRGAPAARTAGGVPMGGAGADDRGEGPGPTDD